jgi:hypothetical protein
METYKIGNATVRIHGEVDQEKIKAATTAFLKKVEAERRRKGKERKT